MNETPIISVNKVGMEARPTGRGLREGPCDRVRHPKAGGPTAAPSVKASASTPLSGTTLDFIIDEKGNQVNVRRAVVPTLNSTVIELTAKGEPNIPHVTGAKAIIEGEISFDGQFANFGQGNDTLDQGTAEVNEGDAAKLGDVIGDYTVARSPPRWRLMSRATTPLTGATTTAGQICWLLDEALCHIGDMTTMISVPMVRKPAEFTRVTALEGEERWKEALLIPHGVMLTYFGDVIERRMR